MAKKETLDLSEINDAVEKLEKSFDDKILELHKVQGGQTERHAFCYYREILWKIRDELKKVNN